MKKKDIMVCFHHVYSWFNCNLTDKQKEEFFKNWPGFHWVEESDEKVNKHLNSHSILTIEFYINIMVEHLAKYDKHTKKIIASCKTGRS